MTNQKLFDQINNIKKQIKDNRDERNNHHLIIQDLDNDYFKLTAILIDLLKQIDYEGVYKI